MNYFRECKKLTQIHYLTLINSFYNARNEISWFQHSLVVYVCLLRTITEWRYRKSIVPSNHWKLVLFSVTLTLEAVKFNFEHLHSTFRQKFPSNGQKKQGEKKKINTQWLSENAAKRMYVCVQLSVRYNSSSVYFINILSKR